MKTKKNVSANKSLSLMARETNKEKIIRLVRELKIQEFAGWEDIDFQNIESIRETKLMSEELAILRKELEEISFNRREMELAIEEAGDLERARKRLEEITVEDFFESENPTLKKESKGDGLPEKPLKNDVKIKERTVVTENKIESDFIKQTIMRNIETDAVEVDATPTVDIQVFDNEPPLGESPSANQYSRPNYVSDFPIITDESWRSNIPSFVMEYIPDWETISLEELMLQLKDIKRQFNRESSDEIDDYLCELEDFKLEEDESEYFDPLEIIARFEHGAVKKVKEVDEGFDDITWRKTIPGVLKQQFRNWNTMLLDDFYGQAKEFMDSGVLERDVQRLVFEFVVELSQLIFERNNVEPVVIEEEETEEFTDTDADSIMSLVEMIILPRLEAIDKIAETGGRVKYANLWSVPFTEELTNKVKDRDGWKCVICESEADLHVHHKIPRNLGGIHHMFNLVTLCSSCHPAIETGSIDQAYKKCLANYKKNKFNSRFRKENLSRDKQLLKEEVQQGLDAFLLELNKRDEIKLMENLIEIMNRIDVIFYE